MKLLNLFIDESGIPNPKVPQSETYILSGCVVRDDFRKELKIKADQIKFKYWSRTDVIFHSKEIARKEGDFKILKEKSVKDNFFHDLFNFLNTNTYYMFFVVVDKSKAVTSNWNDNKVYIETASLMIKNFILSLLAQGDIKGRLVIEAATSLKDFSFHKMASHFLSRGIEEISVPYNQIQDVLTEISFVTKKNQDIEEQMADLLAYGAKLKFLKKKLEDLNDYQKNILNVMNKKLFKMHPETGDKKKKYYSLINSFKIIP